jgi:IS4 transposase
MFTTVALLILRGHKLSLQNALNRVFTALGAIFCVPTASAYSQARQKLKPELFIELNESVRDDFYQLYEEDGLVKRWRGHRLLACDGTYLTLPDNVDTRAEFSVQENQYEEGACVQALACVLYDLLNDVVIGAALGKRQGENKLLFAHLWQQSQVNDLMIFDRHYADYILFAKGYADQRHVLVRLPSNSFIAAQNFWHSDLPEQTVRLQCPARARKFAQENNLPLEIDVRLIRVILDNGEIEVLATTLLDKEKYPVAEFKQLYGSRWGEETFFGRIKNIFEIERFSGTTPTAIKQDFYGVLFLATLESVLAKSAEEQLQQQAVERGNQLVPHVNHSVSYLALVDRVVDLLAAKRSEKQVLEELHHLFRTNPTRARPNRKVERKKALRFAYKLRFHKYVKRLLA